MCCGGEAGEEEAAGRGLGQIEAKLVILASGNVDEIRQGVLRPKRRHQTRQTSCDYRQRGASVCLRESMYSAGAPELKMLP